MRIIESEDLPAWVKDLYDQQTPRFVPGLWTIDEVGDYHMWSTLGSFHKRDLISRKAPKGIDPDTIVDWYDLPTWIKGSYTSQDEMDRLKSYTWSKGTESTWFAYEPNGRYAGIWEKE